MVKGLHFGILMLTATFSSVATAQPRSSVAKPQQSTSARIYITHITVINTETGKEVHDRTVVISGERISAVAESKGAKVRSGAKVVDGSGKYLIPGLWDLHVHTLAPERRDTYFPLCLANGITGFRDTGAWIPLPEVQRWRQESAGGALVGPRIIGVAGPLVDGPGAKHVRTGGSPNDTGGTVNVSNAAEARAAVASLQQQGADFIKVYNQLPREAFFAIADEANRRSIPFIGHVPIAVTVAEASNAGQRSMEHLDGPILECAFANMPKLREEMSLGKGPSPKEILEAALQDCDPATMTPLFRLLAKNDTWQVPTLVQLLFTESPDPEEDSRLKYVIRPIRNEWAAMLPEFRKSASLWHRIFLLKLEMVRAMHAQRVRFLIGTDTPSYSGTIAGFALHDELRLFVRAGFTPAEALKAATSDAAEFMGKQKDFGSVAKGKIADLVLLNADPLTDIHNTTRISAVFLGGKEFDRAALDALLKRAEEAAR
jgi:imidazolonepropionase-like amidohydrolase